MTYGKSFLPFNPPSLFFSVCNALLSMNKLIFSPENVKENQSNKSNATPSTNKIILDYLLYLSIQSRLNQASIELLELSDPLPKEKERLEVRKKRWVESATKAEQDKRAVESIVAGNNKKNVIKLR